MRHGYTRKAKGNYPFQRGKIEIGKVSKLTKSYRVSDKRTNLTESQEILNQRKGALKVVN